MKLTFGKTIASVLVLGLLVSGAFFATRKPPRDRSAYLHRPESQSDSVIAQPALPGESEFAASKLIATANSTEPASTATPNNTESALDWSRFRGPNGMGVSLDTTIPTEWSETKNLRWKAKLPGPGSSSPVLTDRSACVFDHLYRLWGGGK